jgi:hypothetical protein
MTRKSNARLAGFLFIFYIAVALAGMILFRRVSAGDGIPAKLANIAAHAPLMRICVLSDLLTVFCAIGLGVTLYALTRHQDSDLALIAMMCRVAEGILGASATIASLSLLQVSMNAATATGADLATLQTVGGVLLKGGGGMTVGATIFSVGSAIFAWLFVRARTIPVWLAWTGLIGSLLAIVMLPLEGFHLIGGSVMWVMWLPLLVYELTLGVMLLAGRIGEATS